MCGNLARKFDVQQIDSSWQLSNLTFVFFAVCDKDFDLVFVIDGSGSIEQAGRGNFGRVKNFLKQVVKGFKVGFDASHVGAVVYSSSQYVKKVFGLNDHYSGSEVEKAIDKIRYPSGGTYTGKALTVVIQQVYTRNADRPDVPNVVMVITDGKANDDVSLGANQLKDDGTSVFAIGVGTNYDEAELRVIASSPRNVYTADFAQLDTVISRIKLSACQGMTLKESYLYSMAYCNGCNSSIHFYKSQEIRSSCGWKIFLEAYSIGNS